MSDNGFILGKVEPEPTPFKGESEKQLEKQDLDPEVRALLEKDIRAEYKIEVMFGHPRTTYGPNNVCITLWESGKAYHGGGDDQMSWCRDVQAGSELGCGLFIPSNCVRSITAVGLVAICPHCNFAINAERLTREQYHRVTTQNLAIKVAGLFRSMKFSADIYCKYSPGDIRYDAKVKTFGWEKARLLRGRMIYPLKNILKDTAAGSSLESRFEALFKA